MKRSAIILASITLFVLSISNCSDSNSRRKVKINGGISFQLEAGGGNISNSNTDDYNPIVLVESSGFLTLVFASNRDPVTQSASTTPSHNIFITRTVGPYFGIGPFPPFKVPVALNASSTGARFNKSQRIKFTARINSSASGIDVIYTNSGNNNIKQVTVNSPFTGVHNSPINLQNASSVTGTVIGIDNDLGSNTAKIIYRISNGNIILADPDGSSASNDSLSNISIANDSKVSGVHFDVSFFPKSYYYTNAGKIYAAENDATIGESLQWNEALADHGLLASNVSNFYSPSLFLSGVTFSAGNSQNGNQDLYAIINQDLFSLWFLNFATAGPAGVFGLSDLDFAFSFMDFGNAFVDVDFTDEVYGSSSASVPAVIGDFTLFFVQNGGTATGATISSISDFDDSALVGGEYGIRFNLNVSGTPDGSEYIVISPTNGSSIFGYSGLPADASASTGPVFFWAGTPPLGPYISSYTLDSANAFIDVDFDVGVYGAASSTLTASNFTLIFVQGAGTATNTTISSITNNASSSLVNGELTIRFHLSVTGTPDGFESIEITPFDGSSVFDFLSIPMLATETTDQTAYSNIIN